MKNRPDSSRKIIASGSRGLFTLPLTAVMGEKERMRVNFFVDGKLYQKYF